MARLVLTLVFGFAASAAFVVWDMRTDAEAISDATPIAVTASPS